MAFRDLFFISFQLPAIGKALELRKTCQVREQIDREFAALEAARARTPDARSR